MKGANLINVKSRQLDFIEIAETSICSNHGNDFEEFRFYLFLFAGPTLIFLWLRGKGNFLVLDVEADILVLIVQRSSLLSTRENVTDVCLSRDLKSLYKWEGIESKSESTIRT